MKKIKYVNAHSELRNSVCKLASVASELNKEAWVGPAICRHECFENYFSHPYFSYSKFTSSSKVAELVFVLERKAEVAA